MTQQGKALTPEQKEFIITLKKSFDLEKKEGPVVSTKDPTGRVTRGLGISRRTIDSVMSSYR